MSSGPEFYPGFVYSDLKAAMAWLEEAFGFRTLMAVPNADGSYAHVEMAYGPIIIMPSGARNEWGWKSPRDAGATTASLYVYVPDDELSAHYARAKEAGAEIVQVHAPAQGLAVGQQDHPALQIHIRCPWRATRGRAVEGRTTLGAEIGAGGVFLLAARTLHSEASQRVEAGNGRTGGESLVWRAGRGQGRFPRISTSGLPRPGSDCLERFGPDF